MITIDTLVKTCSTISSPHDLDIDYLDINIKLSKLKNYLIDSCIDPDLSKLDNDSDEYIILQHEDMFTIDDMYAQHEVSEKVNVDVELEEIIYELESNDIPIKLEKYNNLDEEIRYKFLMDFLERNKTIPLEEFINKFNVNS